MGVRGGAPQVLLDRRGGHWTWPWWRGSFGGAVQKEKEETPDSDKRGPPSTTRFREVEKGRRLAAPGSVREPDHIPHGRTRQYRPTGMRAKEPDTRPRPKAGAVCVRVETRKNKILLRTGGVGNGGAIIQGKAGESQKLTCAVTALDSKSESTQVGQGARA